MTDYACQDCNFIGSLPHFCPVKKSATTISKDSDSAATTDLDRDSAEAQSDVAPVAENTGRLLTSKGAGTGLEVMFCLRHRWATVVPPGRYEPCPECRGYSIGTHIGDLCDLQFRAQKAEAEVTRLTAELADHKKKQDHYVSESLKIAAEAGEQIQQLTAQLEERERHCKEWGALHKKVCADFETQLEEAKARIEEESGNYIEMMELRDRAARDASKAKRELEEAKAERARWAKDCWQLAHHMQSPVMEVSRKEAQQIAERVIRGGYPTAPSAKEEPKPAEGLIEELSRLEAEYVGACSGDETERLIVVEEYAAFLFQHRLEIAAGLTAANPSTVANAPSGVEPWTKPCTAAQAKKEFDDACAQDAAAVDVEPWVPKVGDRVRSVASGNSGSWLRASTDPTSRKHVVTADAATAERIGGSIFYADPSDIEPAPPVTEEQARKLVAEIAEGHKAQLEADDPRGKPVPKELDWFGEARHALTEWQLRQRSVDLNDCLVSLVQGCQELSGKQGR